MKWITYDVELAGETELLGGMPKTKELIEGMMSSKEIRLKAKALGRDPERIIAENMQDMGAPGEVPEELLEQEKMACGFRQSPEGYLALGAHQIPSMLIDAATTLKLSTKVRGMKDTLTRGTTAWQEGRGRLLLIVDGTGGEITEPTGTREWGSQIKDRMGSRAILRRYDYVHPWGLSFRIRYVDNEIITQAAWADLWELACVQGLGAARPRDYGKFRVVTMKIE